VRGWLSQAERNNSCPLAEASGDATPSALRQLLRLAFWDSETGRDELRRPVLQHLGDSEAVLVLDDTGFLNKGLHPEGVALQYRGAAVRIENGQIGVFLGYAGPLGHTLLDREIYLPQAWTDDCNTKTGRSILLLTRSLREWYPRRCRAGPPVATQRRAATGGCPTNASNRGGPPCPNALWFDLAGGSAPS
jgi:DDE superfamily endonuclease